MLAVDVGQVLVHLGLVIVVAEETPHACIGIAYRREGDRTIGIAETEVLILAVEIAFLARKGNDVLGVQAVLGVIQGKLAYAGEIGMGTDAVVGDAYGYPHCAFHARPLADNLENPGLVLVAHGNRLARAAVAVLLQEVGHDDDGLTCRCGTLQSQIHHREIVEQTFGILQLQAAVKGGFHDAHLLLINMADDVIGVFHLRNIASHGPTAPLADGNFLAFVVFAARSARQGAGEAIAITVISANHGAVNRRRLANNEVGACPRRCDCQSQRHHEKREK